MFWVVLLAWLAVWPLTPAHPEGIWSAHLFAVALMALAVVPRLWRTSRVTLGVPAAAAGLMLVSLALATWLARDAFPWRDMVWTGLTGVAHAVFFGVCLCVAPRPEGAGEEQDEAACRDASRAMALVLLATLLGQLVMMVLVDPEDDPAWRPAGTLGNPNALGALLAAGALVLGALARWRGPTVVLVAILGLALLATRSRGAAAAVAVVVAVAAIRRFGLRAVLGLAVAAALVWLVPNPLEQRIRDMEPEHSFSRPFIWRASLQVAAEHPAGIGPGNNHYVFPALAHDPERPWLLHQRHAVGLTHNVFLTVLVEWGWLAGAAALWMLLWSARRLASRGPPDPLRLAATLGAAVLFVELQVDGIEQSPTVFSVFLWLSAFALARVPGSGSGGRRGVAVPGGALAVGAIVTALLLAVPAVERRVLDDHVRRLEATIGAHEQGAVSLEQLRQAFAFVTALQSDASRPWRRWLRFEQERLRDLPEDASATERQTTLELAEAALERARAADPRDLVTLRLGAELMRRAAEGQVDDEARAARQAAFFELMESLLARDPLDVEARFQLASEYHRTGSLDRRDAELDRVFQLEPDYAWAWYQRARMLDRGEDPEAALHAYVRTMEAVMNCRVKVRVGNPLSQRFYRKNLDQVDSKRVWLRVYELRQEVYF